MGKRGPLKGCGGRPRKTVCERTPVSAPPVSKHGVKTLSNLECYKIPPAATCPISGKRGIVTAADIFRELWRRVLEVMGDQPGLQLFAECYATNYARCLYCEHLLNELDEETKLTLEGKRIASIYGKMVQEYRRYYQEDWQNLLKMMCLCASQDPAWLQENGFLTNLYVVQAETGGPVKIGIAKNVAKRLKGLQTGHPSKLKVVRVLENVPPRLEKRLHGKYKHSQECGEWFDERILPDLLYTLDELKKSNIKGLKL